MKIFVCSLKRGFTMLEVMIVIGMIAIIMLITIPTLRSRRSRVDLDTTTNQIVADLREAQGRAVAQESQTAWGVHLENSTVTPPFYALFSTSYNSSNIISYMRLPPSVQYDSSSLPQGKYTEITFLPLSASPVGLSGSNSTSVALVLQFPGGNVVATSTITISGNGLVTY